MLKVVYIDSQYHYYLNMPPIQLCYQVKKVMLSSQTTKPSSTKHQVIAQDMIFITLAETERCILSSVSQRCDADGTVQVHKTVDLNSRNATVPADSKQQCCVDGQL